jgi:hypothetical protein
MTLHTEEILDTIVRLGELFDDETLLHWPNLPFLELARGQLGVVGKRFVCPFNTREVEVDFFAPAGQPGRLLGVQSCSAWKEETECHRSCVDIPQAQAAPAFSHRFLLCRRRPAVSPGEPSEV